MFMRVLTGLRLQTPMRVGPPPIILILLLIALVISLPHFSPLFAPKRYAKIRRTQKPLGKSWQALEGAGSPVEGELSDTSRFTFHAFDEGGSGTKRQLKAVNGS